MTQLSAGGEHVTCCTCDFGGRVCIWGQSACRGPGNRVCPMQGGIVLAMQGVGGERHTACAGLLLCWRQCRQRIQKLCAFI